MASDRWTNNGHETTSLAAKHLIRHETPLRAASHPNPLRLAQSGAQCNVRCLYRVKGEIFVCSSSVITSPAILHRSSPARESVLLDALAYLAALNAYPAQPT